MAGGVPLLLVENPFHLLEDKADRTIPTATLQIYEFIGQVLQKDKSKASLNPTNRASSASLCWKRRWFQRKNYAEDALAPRKQVNFLLGDLSERVLLYFISRACVGPGKLYSQVDFGKVKGSITFNGHEMQIYQQEDLEADLDGIKVSAHADGFGKRNSDGQWELIECKSAANYGFDDFKVKGPKDYLKQACVLMRTNKALKLHVNSVRFFYLRKETGHLWDQLYYFDPLLYQDVVNEFKASNSDTEYPAPYPLVKEMKGIKGTGRYYATFPCTYCPYLRHCHGNYEIEWRKDGNFHKPKYFFTKGENK